MKCQICNNEYKGLCALGSHITKIHGNIKGYYDKFLKKENEGKCKVCGNDTKYYRLGVGYRETCGYGCSRKLMHTPSAREKSRNTCLKKYGVEYFQSLDESRKNVSEKAKNRLLNPNEKLKISIKTKEAMDRPEVRKNYLNSRVLMSTDQKQKLSEIMKLKHLDPEFRKKIYTEKRNKKISESKKIYWATHLKERNRIMDIWKKRKETRLEVKLYNFLETNNIKFIKKYELENKQYDAYLIDYNILLEFDGEFWHKQSLTECKYTFQITNYYNDLLKNEISKKHNIPLFRIRENESPKKILDFLQKTIL